MPVTAARAPGAVGAAAVTVVAVGFASPPPGQAPGIGAGRWNPCRFADRQLRAVSIRVLAEVLLSIGIGSGGVALGRGAAAIADRATDGRDGARTCEESGQESDGGHDSQHGGGWWRRLVTAR